jgi:hypothetical protein
MSAYDPKRTFWSSAHAVDGASSPSPAIRGLFRHGEICSARPEGKRYLRVHASYRPLGLALIVSKVRPSSSKAESGIEKQVRPVRQQFPSNLHCLLVSALARIWQGRETAAAAE